MSKNLNTLAALSVGTEVVSLFPFGGESENDLSFEEGEKLIITGKTSDKAWYVARNLENKTGRIPRHYVKDIKEIRATIPKYPWLLERISRSDAETLLTDSNMGTFLIRESQHFPGDYTLSIKGNDIQHYRIKKENGQYTIDDETLFPDLLKLIEHYKDDADGLCCPLKRPVVGHTLNSDSSAVVDATSFPHVNPYIKPSDLVIDCLIGQGEYGKVHKALLENRETVAIKILKKSTAVQEFMKEVNVMLSLEHPNLVRLYGVSVLNDSLCIVMEYMAKGSLLDYLITRGRNLISSKELLQFAIDTCSGLQYLECKKIVHRDVAASNVLISEKGTAKLSDFGLSRQIEDDDTVSTKVRVKWAAPESLEKKIYSNKSDMWSFGILLWEIYSFGRLPYPRIPMSGVQQYIKTGNRMDPPEDCPLEIRKLMKSAWNYNPEERPTFSEALNVLKGISSR